MRQNNLSSFLFNELFNNYIFAISYIAKKQKKTIKITQIIKININQLSFFFRMNSHFKNANISDPLTPSRRNQPNREIDQDHAPPLSPYVNGKKNQKFVNPSLVSNQVFYTHEYDRSASKSPLSHTPRKGNDSENMNKIINHSSVPTKKNVPDCAEPTSLQKNVYNSDRPQTPTPRKFMLEDGGSSNKLNRLGVNTFEDGNENPTITSKGNGVLKEKNAESSNKFENFNNSSTPKKNPNETTPRGKRADENIKPVTPTHSIHSAHSLHSHSDDLLCPDCVNKLLKNQKDEKKKLDKEAEKNVNRDALAKLAEDEQKKQAQQKELKDRVREDMKKMELIAKEKKEKEKAEKMNQRLNPAGDPLFDAHQKKLEKIRMEKCEALKKELQDQLRDNEERKFQDMQREKLINSTLAPIEFGNEYRNIFEGKQNEFRDHLKNQIKLSMEKKKVEKETERKVKEEQEKIWQKAQEEMIQKEVTNQKHQKDIFMRALEENKKAKELKKIQEKAEVQKEYDYVEKMNKIAEENLQKELEKKNKLRDEMQSALKSQIAVNKVRKEDQKKEELKIMPIQEAPHVDPTGNCDECSRTAPLATMSKRRFVQKQAPADRSSYAKIYSNKFHQLHIRIQIDEQQRKQKDNKLEPL